jgi:hypothetical protein
MMLPFLNTAAALLLLQHAAMQLTLLLHVLTADGRTKHSCLTCMSYLASD